MLWRRVALTLLVAGTVSGQQIHLKTRNIDTSVSTPAPGARRTHISQTVRVHRIVQLDHAPGVEDLDSLARAGAEVLSVVPDNALVVSMASGATLPRSQYRWVSEIDPADKLSPSLPHDGAGQAIIEFHPDITQAGQDAVIASAGLSPVRSGVLLANHVIVNASFPQLSLLADEDAVAYIFPAATDLANGADLMPCAGMLTTAGPVAQYSNIVHGWDAVNGSVVLNYVFGTLTPKQAPASVESEIVRALEAWSQKANIQFQPSANISAVRTIYVWFASGAHGDAYPFTSPAVLAHTFYPVPINPESIAGDMHLNLDEDWNIGGDIDIYSVALHEIGHAIGLGHTDNPGDVMYPYYRRNMTLSANDIGAAISLYGPPPSGISPAAAPNVPSSGAMPASSSVPSPTSSSEPAPASPSEPAPASPSEPAPASPSNPAPAPANPPVNITLDSTPASTQANTASVSGTIAGGAAPFTVQWQTDQSHSGTAAVTNGTWSASGIPLVIGANNITVTVFDALHNTASRTATISLVRPAPAGAAPVSLRITSPASTVTSTGSPTVSVAGQTSGGSGGVSKVTWQTLAGASGTATGTSDWMASNIPLLEGTNTIVVRAFDASGASAWAALVIVRQ